MSLRQGKTLLESEKSFLEPDTVDVIAKDGSPEAIEVRCSVRYLMSRSLSKLDSNNQLYTLRKKWTE